MRRFRSDSSRPGGRRARASAALLLAAALVAGVAGCGDGATPSGDVPTVAAAQPSARLVDARAFAEVVDKPGTVVLDVRTPAEFAAGHLPGAINLDVQDPGFTDALAGLDPESRYAVYCRSGNRSGVAVAIMESAGFDDVVHLDGGISSWIAAQLPVQAD